MENSLFKLLSSVRFLSLEQTNKAKTNKWGEKKNKKKTEDQKKIKPWFSNFIEFH